jgi:hypothetical protein
MQSAILCRRYMPASAFLASVRGDVEIIRKRGKPHALRYAARHEVYDANGYHEGYIAAAFVYPLVPATPAETFPPTRWTGSIATANGPFDEDQARDLAPFLVCLDEQPSMCILEAPPTAYYNCDHCDAEYTKRRVGARCAKSPSGEHEFDTRYATPDTDELYDMLCPTHEGWDDRGPTTSTRLPYYRWTFGRSDEYPDGCWSLIPSR